MIWAVMFTLIWSLFKLLLYVSCCLICVYMGHSTELVQTAAPQRKKKTLLKSIYEVKILDVS